MDSTEKMIQDKIWGGMHYPDIDEKEADAVIFGIPFDGGVSFRAGASKAPQAIRSITYTIPPSNEYFEDMSSVKIKDIGDFAETDREKLFAEVRSKVKSLVENDTFFGMIGGDHSVTIPVLEGINDAVDEPFGIIHLDSHFDLCDELDGDRLSHGCTQRRAVELSNVGGPENLFFVGIRSAEPDELNYMRDNKLHLISAVDFEPLYTKNTIEQIQTEMSKFSKIYVTIDVDILDIFGTGTPQIGGITARNLLDILRGIFDLPIIGFDVVEVAPDLDPAWGSVFVGRRLMTECIGHHVRKTKGLEFCRK